VSETGTAPTAGRIVHVVVEGKHRSGMITQAPPDGPLEIEVFHSYDGGFYADLPYDPDPEVGDATHNRTWHWPERA
jgi:hypothetical protein